MIVERERPLSIRAATAADRAAVRGLCRAALRPEDTFDEAGLERVLWSPPHMTSVPLVATEADIVIGFASGLCTPGDATLGFVTVIVVRSDQRGRGVGIALLAALENELQGFGVTEAWTAGSLPNYWWPGVPEEYPEGHRLFVRAGYELDDIAHNMTVALAEDLLDEHQVDGVDLRRLERAELPRLQAWVAERWSKDGWDREIELTLGRDPISCFVALQQGEYIGFAAYDANRLGCFGPMGSAEQARGRGVGAALLRRCLRDYVVRGEQQCQISWVGPEGFYRGAVGAVPGRRFDRMRKELGG